MTQLFTDTNATFVDYACEYARRASRSLPEDPRLRAGVEVALERDLVEGPVVEEILRVVLRDEEGVRDFVRRSLGGLLAARHRTAGVLLATMRSDRCDQTFERRFGGVASAGLIDALVTLLHDPDDRVGARTAWAAGLAMRNEPRLAALVEAAQESEVAEHRRRAFVARVAAWSTDAQGDPLGLEDVVADEHRLGAVLRALEYAGGRCPPFVLARIADLVAGTRSRVIAAAWARLESMPWFEDEAPFGRPVFDLDPESGGGDPLFAWVHGPRGELGDRMFQGLVALRAAVRDRVSACAPIAEELFGVCEQLSESPSRTPMLDAALDDVLFRTSFVRDAAVASAASPAQAVAVVHRHRALVRRLLDSRLDRLDPSDLQVERTASKYRSASLVLDSFAFRSPDSTADAPSEGTPFERVHTHVLEELRASEPRPRLARPMALAWATSANRRSHVDSLFCERIAHDLLDVQPSMEAFLRFAGMWVDDEPLGSMLCSLHRLVRFVDASVRSKKRPTLTELSDRLAGCARSTGAIRAHAVWASSLLGLEALASALREASASGSSLELEDRLVAAIRAVQATSPHESSAPSRRHDPLLLARSVLLSTDLLEARLHDSRLLGREGWWRAVRSTRGARIPVRLLVLLLECFEVERDLRRLEREERPSVPAPRRPTRIGPYEVLGHIGNPQETGMGECLRVKLVGQASNPERVMKRVKPGISQALFREEARAMLGLASANHPGIVRFLAFAEDVGESPYLVMELVPGPNLARRLAVGPASVLDAARCVERMADALACAHAHGIAHLDLKPANVILRHGEMSDAVIIDWGLAGTNGEWGSFGYVSPERLGAGQSVEYRSSRHWAGASDVFALGAILVELLSGANPLHTDACPLGPEERPAHLADFLDSIEDPGHRADLEQDLLLREPGLLDARVVRFLVGIPDALVQVARMCLVLDHRMRPSSRQVTEVLRHLAATDRRPAADRPV